jgi:hypothetical protein
VTAVVGGPLPATVNVPAVGGISPSLGFPGNTIPAGTTVSVSNGLTPPSGISTSAVSRGRDARPRAFDTLPSTAFDFIGLEFTSSFSLPILPSITFTISPPPSANQQYFLALYTPATGWIDAEDGPGYLSGSTITFPSNVLTTPLAIVANTQYALALYTQPGMSPTPPPQPVASFGPGTYATVPLSASTTSPITLTTTGAYGGTIDFPAFVAGNDCKGATPSVSGAYGTSAPSGSPVFASGGNDFYLTVTFSCSVVLAGPGSAMLQVPSGSVGIDYSVGGGAYTSTGLSISPTGASSNGYTNVTISTPAGLTATIPGGTTYTLVFFPTSVQ